MKKKHLKKQVKYLIVGLVIVLVVVVCFVFQPFKKKQTTTDSTSTVEETVSEYPYQTTWNEYHEINNDYVGTIQFESGLLELPFVQGSDNTTYFHTNWQTMEADDAGSISLNSTNTLEDQNLVLIGHTVDESIDPDRTQMFSPLSSLTNVDNYEANKSVKLYLENEVREYVVAYIFECPLIYEEIDGQAYYYSEEGYEFYYENYSEEEFNTYINTIKEHSYYDTCVEISYTDKMLTLESCVADQDTSRTIVVLKEINRTEY